MIVGDLIAALSAYPADMQVVVHGYELGYNDVLTVTTIPLKLNVYSEWYFGKHDQPERYETPDATAVLISATES